MYTYIFFFVHEFVDMCVLIHQCHGCFALYLCAGVCVNGPALSLCGREMWFLG
jgi:hypothetical protein